VNKIEQIKARFKKNI